MGKNEDQIATWYDLKTYLGYRLPYGAENELRKCVTYVDLNDCQQGYLPGYYADYQNASDAEKRLHTTKSTFLSHVFGVSGYTQYLVTTSDVGPYSSETSKSYTLSVSNGLSNTQEVTCYTFTATRDLNSTSITWYNFQFWVVCNVSGTLHGVITIREDVTDRVISRGFINQSLTSTLSKQKLTIDSGLDAISDLSSDTNYKIVISFYVTTSGNSGSDGSGLLNPIQPSFLLPIKFYRSDPSASFSLSPYDPDQTGEQGYKCVRYDQIKANTEATVPVYVQVKNTYGTYINADYVQFIYYYKLVNGSWTSKTVGEADWDRIPANTTVSTTVYVLINPVIGDIESDYLEIYFGRSNSNRDMAYTVYSGGTEIMSNSGRWASITIRWNENIYAGAYRDVLKQITAVHFSVD